MNPLEGLIASQDDCFDIIKFLEQTDPKIFTELVLVSRNLPGKPLNIDPRIGSQLASVGLLKEGVGYYYLSDIAINSLQEYLGETIDSFKATILMLATNDRPLYLKFQNYLFNPRFSNLTGEEKNELIQLGLMIDRSTVHYLVYPGVFQIAIQLAH